MKFSEEFLKNKAELEDILRQIDAGEMESISLEEFEKESEEILKKI